MDGSAAQNQLVSVTERAAPAEMVVWAEKRSAWQKDAP